MTETEPQPYEQKAAAHRAYLRSQIPSEWTLKTIPSASEEPNAAHFIDSHCSDRENLICRLSVSELAESVKNREYSAYEVTSAFCHRAALAHQLCNCLVEIFFNEALETAKHLDEHLAKHGTPIGPLHGVPVSLKDQFNVLGKTTTLGYIGLLDRPRPDSESESDIVKDLRRLGAVLYVKTTVPMSMMCAETVSNLMGYTCNAVNRNLSSGGSSGGEGALLAAAASPLGWGTDIGGSVRIPSVFHGLYALRPTSGRLSYRNVANTMEGQNIMPSVIGPMARNITDIDYILRAVLNAQPPPWISDPCVVPLRWTREGTVEAGRKLSFAVMPSDGIITPHPPVQRAVDDVITRLRAAGHEVLIWDAELIPELYRVSSDVYHSDDYREIRELAEESGEPLIPSLARAVERVAINGPHYTVNGYWGLQKRKTAIQREYFAKWEATKAKTASGKPVDAVITPAWTSASCLPGNTDRTTVMTRFVNVIDCPAVTFPVLRADKSVDVVSEFQPLSEFDAQHMKLYDGELFHGMPVGLQVLCRRFEDEKSVAITQVLADLVEFK